MKRPQKRKRKPYWFEPESVRAVPRIADPALAKAYGGQPTGFESDAFWDYVTWLPDEQLRDPALRAVVDADALGSRAPINKFLKSGQMVSEFGRGLIKDYDNRQLKGKRGPKPIPVYARSLAEAIRLHARQLVRHLMSEGVSRDEALAKAARQYGLDIETLDDFKMGKLGSSRRMDARRKKFLKPKSKSGRV